MTCRARVTVAALLLLAGSIAVSEAWATFPGGNGKILYIGPASNAVTELDLFVVDPDGSGRTNLTADFSGDVYGGDWSPDGSRIAFLRGVFRRDNSFSSLWGLWVMDPDGSNKLRLRRFTGPYYPGLTWSPDGRSIVIPRLDDDSADFFAVNVDGTGERRLTDFRQALVVEPSWSPDGSTLAFVGIFETEEYGVYLVNPGGTGLRRLFEPSIAHPDWSPDGSWLLVSDDYENLRVPPDGSSYTVIPRAQTGEFSGPSWSPDGTKVLWAGEGEVAYANTDGKCAVPVLRANAFGARWQPVPGGATSAVTRCADLVLAGSFLQRNAAAGKPVTYRATIRNRGNEPASDVVLVDRLDRGFRFAGSSGADCAGTRVLHCPIGTLEPGERATVELRLVPLRGLAIPHFLEATTTSYDPDQARNRKMDAIWACSHGGTPHADVIRGTPRADVICGGAGSDRIFGLGGRDIIDGHDGDDVVYGGGGADEISGGRGNDTLFGEGGSDYIAGNAGNNALFGGPGTDRLHAEEGRDFMDGGPGRDYGAFDDGDTVRSVEEGEGGPLTGRLPAFLASHLR